VAPTSLLLPTSLCRRCGSPAGPFPPSKELAAFSPWYYGGCVLQSAVQCVRFSHFCSSLREENESLFVALPPRQLCHPFPTAPAGFGTPAASLHHHHRAARFPLPREQAGRWALHCQLLPIPRQPHHSREGRPLTTGCSAPDPATSFLLSFFRNTGSPGGSGLRQPRQGRILSPSATMGLS
jgi:hypothetical protein